MTTVYFVRHGESLANRDHVYIGQTDLDLSPLGYEQAEKTAAYLQNIPCAKIYSSDLQRAYHTAEKTARLKGMDIEPCQGLREINAGRWENKTYAYLLEQEAKEYAVWSKNIGMAACPGGESVETFVRRFSSCAEALARQHDGETIFIFCHATCIRIMAAFWQNLPRDAWQTIPWPSNASVSKAEYDGQAFHFLSYSEDFFLEDLKREVIIYS